MPRRAAPQLFLALALAACGEGGGAQPPLPQVEPAQLERLARLGYGDWSAPLAPASLERAGVVTLDPARAQPGYNLYTSLPGHEARLVDLRGAVVHTWRAAPEGDPWHHVELSDGGALFVLRNGPLEKRDRHSRLLWRADVKAHHDLDVDDRGRIHVLGSRLRRLGPRALPVIDDEVAVLASDGRVLRRIPLSRLLPEAVSEARLDAVEAFLRAHDLSDEEELALLARTGSPIDVFHANSIELLPRDLPGLGRAGSALLTLRSQDLVVVADLARERVTWRFGPGELDRPHHARLLPSGRVSVFDNGWHREGSRVLRVTRGGRIAWQYPARPGPGFFTRRRGAAQPLANGNLLITESARGRAFEIAPDGEIVWEFLNPEIDRAERRRAQLYRMQRIPAERVAPWL